MRIVWMLPCLMGLGACSPVPTIKTVPVEVVRVERLPVPGELTLPCPGPDYSLVNTYRELVAAVLATDAARKDCAARLQAIRELK